MPPIRALVRQHPDPSGRRTHSLFRAAPASAPTRKRDRQSSTAEQQRSADVNPSVSAMRTPFGEQPHCPLSSATIAQSSGSQEISLGRPPGSGGHLKRPSRRVTQRVTRATCPGRSACPLPAAARRPRIAPGFGSESAARPKRARSSPSDLGARHSIAPDCGAFLNGRRLVSHL
jgi:hypothetical protein